MDFNTTQFKLTQDQLIVLQHFLPKKYVLLKDNPVSQKFSNPKSNIKSSNQLSFTSTESFPLDSRLRNSKHEPSRESFDEETFNETKTNKKQQQLEEKTQTKNLVIKDIKEERLAVRLKTRDLFVMLLDLIQQKKSADLFLEPVNPIKDKIPEYLTIIKKPMDLKTMRTKVNKKQYRNFQEFKKDIDQIVWNCMTFNAGNQYFLKIASKFENDCKLIFQRNKAKIQEQEELIFQMNKSNPKRLKLDASMTSHQSIPKIKRGRSQTKNSKTNDSLNENDLSAEKDVLEKQIKTTKSVRKLKKQSLKGKQSKLCDSKQQILAPSIESLMAPSIESIIKSPNDQKKRPQKQQKSKEEIQSIGSKDEKQTKIQQKLKTKQYKVKENEQKQTENEQSTPESYNERMLRLLRRIHALPKQRRSKFFKEINLQKGNEVNFKALRKEEFFEMERKFNELMTNEQNEKEGSVEKHQNYSPSSKIK